jgi:Resolvase, N terminal domain/Helix-turn-helix domain of resolvase
VKSSAPRSAPAPPPRAATSLRLFWIFFDRATFSWSPDRSPGPVDLGDLQDIVRAVRAAGAALKATEQPIDTSTAAGKCFLDMLGVFAEFETNLRRERQLEGIAKAKAAGVYKGRAAAIDAD